jgi:hypothetical protein
LLLGLVASVAIAVLHGVRGQYPLTAHEAVLRYMTDTYGEPDSKGERFGAQPGAAVPFVTLCAERAITVKGTPHVLVAACHVDDSQGSDVLPISIDLAVLRLDGRGQSTVAAQQDDVQQGGGDTHLQGAVVVQLGPHFFGFRVDSAYFAEGKNMQSATLYAPQGSSLKPVLDLTLYADNSGSDCGHDGHPDCVSFQRKLSFVTSTHEDSVYPVSVTETRDKQSPRNAVFRFDRKRWQYVGPAGFEPTPSL